MSPFHRAALALALTLPLGCKNPEPTVRPAGRSVILIVIDTLRRDHLSLYGYERSTSPGLDRLARESVVFEHCLAPSSWTKPSVASILTGLDSLQHGAHRNRRVADGVELVAEAFRDAGYATAAFSGNPFVSPAFGLSQGFDSFHAGGGQSPKDYPDITLLLDAALEWIGGRPPKPFFVYLHVMNVHGPYRAPPEYRERFREGELDGEFPFQGELWKAVVRRGAAERPTPTPGEKADLVARYDGAIAYTDEKLAEFFAELRSLGVFDESVLVVTSDHGEELLEHGGLGHRKTLYRESLDVPLIIRDGGDGKARRVETPVGLIDVAATMLDLAGVAADVDAFGDGVSLGPLVRGHEGFARTEPLYAHLREWGGSVSLTQRWPHRLLQIDRDYRGRRDVVELYDEVADPAETEDLSRSHPDVVLELVEREARMRAGVSSTGAGEEVELDSELRRRLEALGYIEK